MTELETPQISEIEVLASGLDSPRKLSFGPDGALYVAEAGRGGTGASIPSPSIPGASLFYGATGAITRIQNGNVERVVTGLPRWHYPMDRMHQVLVTLSLMLMETPMRSSVLPAIPPIEIPCYKFLILAS